MAGGLRGLGGRVRGGVGGEGASLPSEEKESHTTWC